MNSAHKVYVAGGVHVVKWLSQNGLEAAEAATVENTGHQTIRAVRIKNQELLTIAWESYDVLKDGKKIATWEVVTDDSRTKIGILVKPVV